MNSLKIPHGCAGCGMPGGVHDELCMYGGVLSKDPAIVRQYQRRDKEGYLHPIGCKCGECSFAADRAVGS